MADYSDAPSDVDRKLAFSEARRRIQLAFDTGDQELNLSDLGALTELPRQISSLSKLKKLFLDSTRVTDLSPISSLSLDTLDIDNTLVIDLTPIAKMNDLSFLYANETGISDLLPLSNIIDLFVLNIDGTHVTDLSPISKIKTLRYLRAARTRVHDIGALSKFDELKELDIADTLVSDISVIENFSSLTSLDISRTPVSDLTPTLRHPRLFKQPRSGGVMFSGCANLSPELQAIAMLQQPGRSMKLEEYLTGNSSNIDDEASSDDEFDISPSDFVQRPAPYEFFWNGALIDSQARRQGPFDNAFAVEMASEVEQKIDSALAMLTENMADARLSSALESAKEEISRGASEIRDGILLMRLRSIQAVAQAYFDASSEYHPSIRAIVMDVAISLEDLLAAFPGARTIDANRQALDFQSDPMAVDIYQNATRSIISSARKSKIVTASAISSLKDGSSEISLLTEVIQTTSSETTRAVAIERRAAIAGLQMLDLRNFLALSVRKAMEEFKPVASESWAAAKDAIPKGVAAGVEGVVSGGIKTAAVALVSTFVSPLAGIAMIVGSFLPISRAARNVAEQVSAAEDASANSTDN